MADESSASCICEICKRNKAFALPRDLLDSVKTGKAVIFAGGGASTEDKLVFPYTLYEDIAQELKIDISVDPPDFPSLMTRFCELPNGRAKLLRKIRERFDYIKSFPELYRSATKFHRELATVFQIDNIVTTNWDDYFEQECGSMPYVHPEDFAMWDLPGRKVFKIHGSINNLGSLVATQEDYAHCYERLQTGIVGSTLKTLLATKTIIYVGYSFQDSDFRKIHEILTSEMKGTRPHSYLVTLDENAKARFDNSVTAIITEASYFLRVLKQHLIVEAQLLPDEVFEDLFALLLKVRANHEKMHLIDLRKHPTAVLTSCYQDGLIHALERMTAGRKTGQYSHTCYLTDKVTAYDEIRRARLKNRLYTDVAYIEGYQNGLVAPLATEQERKVLPIFYVFGASKQPLTFEKYKVALRNAQQDHKTAYKVCQHIVRDRLKNNPDVVFHHTPFLL
jgi:hypothetical protein